MELEKNLVSIGLPAYKKQYFEKALKSLLTQTYDNIEIIIVNDNSPDDLDSIVSVLSDDHRIRYYKNKLNKGSTSLISTWNECLYLAKGEFFILASDDDIYNSDFVSEMIILSKKYPETDLFHSRVAQIDKFDKIINLTPLCPEFENCYDFVWHRINGYRLQYVPDFMCRTVALLSINGFVDFPSGWFSDDATWFLLAKKGGVAYSSKILFFFRYSGINITSTGHIEDKIKANYLFKDWLYSFLEGISGQMISTDVIYNKYIVTLENRNSIVLSTLSYWKLLRELIGIHSSNKEIAIIQAIGRKLFS